MMPPVRMELEGTGDLAKALRDLPKTSMRRAVIHRAFRKSGLPIIVAANAMLPPSAARVGIKVEMRATLSKRQRRGHARDPNAVEMFLGVGPSRLAHLFEFGTGPRYTKSRAKSPTGGSYGKGGLYRGVMKAQPFLRPAWDAGHRKMLVEFGKLLWLEIAATAKRFAKKQARLLAKSGVTP